MGFTTTLSDRPLALHCGAAARAHVDGTRPQRCYAAACMLSDDTGQSEELNHAAMMDCSCTRGNTHTAWQSGQKREEAVARQWLPAALHE